MSSDFLLYGSNGFVGDAVARLALQSNLRPILAGRNEARVSAQAAELGLAYRVFDLDDAGALDAALEEVPVVLHCAGPYLHTFRPMLEACLRTGTHYLDLTGELPVYEALANADSLAREKGVMLLPGAGFDVVPTDCLALHLKQRLLTATHLTLAFYVDGPAKLPPGTVKTAIEMVPYGDKVRRDGLLVPVSEPGFRMVDFGNGPIQAARLTWGDVFTAYISTGIPNIEVYAVISAEMAQQIRFLRKLRPLFNRAFVREFFKRISSGGSTAEEQAQTQTHVWGEVEDGQGQRVAARLHGPEAGVVWTGLAALAAVQQVLDGKATPGFQTPASAFGADFVLQCAGVTREDL